MFLLDIEFLVYTLFLSALSMVSDGKSAVYLIEITLQDKLLLSCYFQDSLYIWHLTV